ncbi:hypothetical protein JM83_2406 [Gillisia sp. Hel_I_86]|uniref:hypothetical protein n=1 Tax=Gillisia sp. Hel_I_86 TaxID=1249981 RepID=UPI00119B7987|nr:hypothetical protein [Gillisia sp. Hel_I_86]TVZ27369.1 hypothetical protein JM83_2406 [Gillisia sp. Hel_I_86]
MIKETYLKVIALLLFIVSPSFAQENTQLKGTISAPFLEEASVHIINSTQKTGTVNSGSGSFQILVKENDELLFSSVQYKNITLVITSEMMKKGILEVVLQEDLNVLDEVNISNISLSGNISTDLQKMKVLDDLPLNYGLSDIKNMRFEADINDSQEAPLNRAFLTNEVIKPGGVNFLALPGAIMAVLGIEEKHQTRIYSGSRRTSSEQLKDLFQQDFFINTLELKESDIDAFIYYADDQGLSNLLKNSNKLVLIEFLMDQSKNYRRELDKN